MADKPKTFTSWSISRYHDWKECPARAKYKHIDKIKEAGSAAMTRGTDIHTLADRYILGMVRSIPKELKQLSVEYKQLRAMGVKRQVTIELMWGMTANWAPIAWDNWSQCWVRVKMDAHYMLPDENVLGIDDHKTGRIKEEQHAEQLELYAISGLVYFPKVPTVRARLLYTDHGKVSELIVPRKELPKLEKAWEKRVKPMFSDTRFFPKPGRHCSWCPHSKSKDGPCPY